MDCRVEPHSETELPRALCPSCISLSFRGFFRPFELRVSQVTKSTEGLTRFSGILLVSRVWKRLMITLYILSSFPIDHVDVCKVIGGGTAGNAIATRLALDPAGYSVAVVETGSFYELDNSNRTTVAGYDYLSLQADTPPSFVNYNIPTVPQAVSSYSDHCRRITSNTHRAIITAQLNMRKVERLVGGTVRYVMQVTARH